MASGGQVTSRTFMNRMDPVDVDSLVPVYKKFISQSH